jgi:pimeloyl-ACP methyl ester carboxylesterase
VAKLALLGTAAPMAVSPGLRAAAVDNPAKAMALINRWSHSPRGSLGGENRASGLWIPGLNLRQMERQPVATLAVDLAACDAYAGAEAAAARVACPTLVVIGGGDRMTPPAAARPILDRLADGRAALVAGAGHALMTEQPEALARLLGGFLKD